MPISIGALGWSDGAGVSSVVCASALTENAPAVARVKTAKPAMNLLFINHLFRRACPYEATNERISMSEGVATAMPKQVGESIYKLFVFSEGNAESRAPDGSIRSNWPTSTKGGGFRPVVVSGKQASELSS